MKNRQQFILVCQRFGYKQIFGLCGLILAQGAPLGYILHRYIFASLSDNFLQHTLMLFKNETVTIIYMWLGSSLFFSLFGIASGYLFSKLEGQKNQISTSFNLLKQFEERKRQIFYSLSDDLHLPVISAIEYLEGYVRGDLGEASVQQKEMASLTLVELKKFHHSFNKLLDYRSRIVSSNSSIKNIFSANDLLCKIHSQLPERKSVVISNIDLNANVQVEIELFTSVLKQVVSQVQKISENNQIKISGTNKALIGENIHEFYYLIVESEGQWDDHASHQWVPAREIIEWHGGMLWTESQNNKIQVYLALPLAPVIAKVA